MGNALDLVCGQFESETVINSQMVSFNGNLYAGTYPNAKVLKLVSN